MFTVVFSIPRWDSLGALGVRAASAAGGIPTAGAGVDPEPAGTVGFTASSLFHMGTLQQSDGCFSQGDDNSAAGQQVWSVYEDPMGSV
jgi:hypothetical protein